MRRGLRASFLLRRMGASRLLIGSVLLAIFITAALTAALVTFSTRALPQAVSRQLRTAPNVSITINGQFSAAQAAADDAVIRSSMRAAFATVPVTLDRALWSDPLGLPAGISTSTSTSTSQAIPLTEAAAPDQITDQSILVSGAWPGPPRRGEPIPAALPVSTARLLRLAPGQVLSLPDRDTGALVRFRLTGTFRPRDPASPYWGLDLIGTSGVTVQGNFVTYGPLIVAPAAFSKARLPAGQASWLAIPAAARIESGSIPGLAARVSQLESRLRQSPALGGLVVVTSIPQLLSSLAANLVVARSVLIISLLQLGLLAAAAIALAARMLASQREEETALLSARGVTRWQLALLTLAEAVVLATAAAAAGTLAGIWLARPLARVGPLHAAQLRITAFPGSAWWTAAAILLVGTAIMLWPALRPASPASARIALGRQARIAGAAQAGADLAVIALGLLAVWQLRGYSAVARSTSGGIGIDPVLVLAPALALAGAALIPLRLLPAAASLTDRLSARSRRLGAALASWQVSRRPIRQSGPVLLVVLAVATGTLALAEHASWQQGAQDQAAFAVGSDVRVDLTAPDPLNQVPAIQHAPGVGSAMPVASFNGAAGGQVVALNAQQAAATVLLRPDLAPVPPAALWKKITPAGPAPGLTLPGRPARLEIAASIRALSGGPALGDLSATLSVQDGAGIVYSVAAGPLPADGRRHDLIAVLSRAVQASYPLRLLGISLAYQLPPIPAGATGTPAQRLAADRATARAAARRAVLTVSGLAVAPSGAGRFASFFASAAALRAWTPAAFATDLDLPGARGSRPLPLAWTGAARGTWELTFRLGYGEVATDKIGPADVAAARVQLAGNLARTRLPLAPAGTWWSGLTTGFLLVTRAAPSAQAGAPPQLEIIYRDALPRYSRLVAGRLPATDTLGASGRIFQAAVTEATAARFSLHVGSRLALPGLTLTVTGIVRPVPPGAAFWTADPTAAGPLTISSPLGAPYWTGAAFVGPGELNDLQGTGLNAAYINLEWDYPLSLGGLTADQIPALQSELTAAASGAATLFNASNENPFDVTIASGLPADLASFASADAAIGSLLSLLFVSLTIIGAVVVLLGARLLTEHRDGEFALMRACGAALRQLAGLALRGGAVVVLPAAVIAAAIGLAVTPGPADPLAWWLAGLTAAVALGGPPLIAVSLFQSFGLIPMLTAAENIGIPLRITATPARAREERVRLLLAVVGLAEHARQRPNELSGGQQQRVAIARALAGSPELLIADEPTGQLDSETGRQIMRLLRTVIQSEGITALVATHDAALMDLADEVLRLEDGRIVGRGAPPDAA